MAFKFLSDEWFDAVSALDPPPPPPGSEGVVLNVCVTGTDQGDVELSLANGAMQRGFTEGAPTTITAPYEVVQKLFVQRDQQAAMQAFMSGQIKIQGDMTKLMAGGQQAPTPEQEAYGQQIIELTDLG